MANEYEKTVQQGKRGKPDIVYYVEKGGSGKTISPEEYEQTKKLGEINKNLKAQDGHTTDMTKLIESQTNLLNSISNSLGQQTSIAEQQAVDDKTTSAAETEDQRWSSPQEMLRAQTSVRLSGGGVQVINHHMKRNARRCGM